MLSEKKKRESSHSMGMWLSVVLVLSAAIAPAILTSSFGYGISPILTGSMAPAAQPGDIYITRLVPVSTVKVGDVIAINNQATGAFYSHRVVEIGMVNGLLRFLTQGDANTSIDRDPYMASTTGTLSVVQTRVPQIGKAIIYMNTIQGRQLTTSLLVTANLIALFVFMFRKKIIASLTPEKVYKELYNEERFISTQYREIIENLQDSLAIEREIKEKVGSSS